MGWSKAQEDNAEAHRAAAHAALDNGDVETARKEALAAIDATPGVLNEMMQRD